MIYFLGFLTLSVGFSKALAFGRPLTPWSCIALIASSRYIAAEPIYRVGLTSKRFSLFLAASDDIPNFWAISKTVISSIYTSICQKKHINQVKIVEKPGIRTLYYTGVKKKSGKNSNFLNFFAPNLDRSSIMWLYCLIVL